LIAQIAEILCVQRFELHKEILARRLRLAPDAETSLDALFRMQRDIRKRQQKPSPHFLDKSIISNLFKLEGVKHLLTS